VTHHAATDLDTSIYDEVNWANPYSFASTPETRSSYKQGYEAGYEAALTDMRERKALQREVIDAAMVDRFSEILADLRQRAA